MSSSWDTVGVVEVVDVPDVVGFLDLKFCIRSFGEISAFAALLNSDDATFATLPNVPTVIGIFPISVTSTGSRPLLIISSMTSACDSWPFLISSSILVKTCEDILGSTLLGLGAVKIGWGRTKGTLKKICDYRNSVWPDFAKFRHFEEILIIIEG